MMKCAWSLVLATLIAVPHVLNAQGFGLFSRKVATINRMLPPSINLKGKKIKIEATADSIQHDGDQLRALLKTKLVTLIQKDPRFILNEISPQTVLKFSITNFYTEKWTINPGTQNARDAYRGKIEVAYQAMDVGTDVALDSENLVQTAGYDPTAGSTSFLGLPSSSSRSNANKVAAEESENETRDQLVNGIVESMAMRIAPTEQPFDAVLPGKKLEPLSSLALSGRWGALEEQADQMEKFPKPEDDTYRLYLVALAKEAQAYDLTREANERDLGKRTDISPKQAEEEFQRAQKYLDEAGAIYKQIITANPKEKEFRPGDTRTEEAIAIYAKIVRYKEENLKAQAALQAKAAEAAKVNGLNGGGRGASVTGGTGQSPLDQILNFCSQGIAPESIEEYIQSADFLDDAKVSGYKFSFAKDPIRLNETCKKNAAIFQRMIRERLASSAAPKPGRKPQ
jgi:tetratricopeptide (TPR) repeat protein